MSGEVENMLCAVWVCRQGQGKIMNSFSWNKKLRGFHGEIPNWDGKHLMQNESYLSRKGKRHGLQIVSIKIGKMKPNSPEYKPCKPGASSRFSITKLGNQPCSAGVKAAGVRSPRSVGGAFTQWKLGKALN